MQVSAIDHVNIVTDDLDGTAGFYADVLGLTRGETPAAAMGMRGAWMSDAAGNALVHIAARETARYADGHQPGVPTGAIHHLAFRCAGFAETQEKLARLGVEHRVNDGRLGLRQIVLKDPNAINVELNFPGD